MASIPAPVTLNIKTTDKMNYKGQQYGITAVAAGVDDGKGTISYAVTLNDSNADVVTVSANNCVLMSTISDVSGNILYQAWEQSVAA